MPIYFDRPVGALADVKELEYMSALHQTDASGVREDGSIKGEDALFFLDLLLLCLRVLMCSIWQQTNHTRFKSQTRISQYI
jgi:hypothetical protein